jgi:hypothetical protein
MERATKLLELLDLEDSLVKQLRSLGDNDDEDGIDAVLEKCKAVNADVR